MPESSWSEWLSRQLAALSVDAQPVPLDPFGDWFRCGGGMGSQGGFAALRLGFHAPCTGYAFGAGYQLAIGALLRRPVDCLRAVCVTEARSTHPANMQVSLQRNGAVWQLDGTKDYVTLANAAERLLVLARRGELADGRADLVLVDVDAASVGLSLNALPALPFVPEIGHASVTFTQVVVHAESILTGDGYQDYVRRFRWLEDRHVSLAVIAYTLRLVWQTERREDWLLALHSCMAGLMALTDVEDEASVLAYRSIEQQWLDVQSAMAVRWRLGDIPQVQWVRDHGITKVARQARQKRYERVAKAWNLLS